MAKDKGPKIDARSSKAEISRAVIQSKAMAYIKVFGKYVCQCQHCKNVWVADKLPKACGRCKRITWDREDKRFKEVKPKGKKRS